MSDNDIAVERLEAQGPSQRARASSQDAPADPSSGPAVGASRKGSQGAAASRVYPTCALDKPISGKPEIGRAPSPWKRGKEKWEAGRPRARETKGRGGGALAKRMPTRFYRLKKSFVPQMSNIAVILSYIICNI
jgi:hypothetical protein